MSCTNRPTGGGVLERSTVRGHPVIEAVWHRTTHSAGATARAVAKVGAQVVVDPERAVTILRPAGRLGEVGLLSPVAVGFDLHPWVDRNTVTRFDRAVRAGAVGGSELIDHVLGVTGDWPERSDLREIVEPFVVSGAGGDRSVSGVAVSARTVRRRLALGIGLSPERVRVLARVGCVRAQLAAPGTSIAAVAAASGYVDQAHLHREFVRWSGCTPGTWRRRATSWRVGEVGDVGECGASGASTGQRS